MLVHFFSSEDWQSWGLGGQPLIPERMPVLIDDFLFEDGYGPRATRVENTWLRTLPSSGAPSPNSWRAYALAARDWLTHLRRHAIGVFALRQDLVAALGTYADRRLSGPLDERLASSSGGLDGHRPRRVDGSGDEGCPLDRAAGDVGGRTSNEPVDFRDR
ncbi:hypothetical protein [Streptomyces sp. NPDC059970]|uniref:hypothetical protein n=1 Tax=Streptomyces sp. NPDC059970 TaxID=3347019 RepID=UPI0036A8A81D